MDISIYPKKELLAKWSEDRKWYEAAADWAAGAGVAEGDGTSFHGERNVTRQELVTMLWRYARSKGYPTGAEAALDAFPDAPAVFPYAREAMRWAVARGIIQGGDGLLDPAGIATRAQVAAVMARFINNVADRA